MGWLIFAQIPVQGWVINPDEHCFLDGTGEALWFPANYGEVVKCDVVSFCLEVIEDGRGGLKMFLVSFTNISACFPYVFRLQPG